MSQLPRSGAKQRCRDDALQHIPRQLEPRRRMTGKGAAPNKAEGDLIGIAQPVHP